MDRCQNLKDPATGKTEAEEIAAMDATTIQRLIGRWQDVQKCNPFGSKDWEWASDALKPLFAEMAKRQAMGSL